MYTPTSTLRMLSVAALVAVTVSACGLLGDQEDPEHATTQSTPVEETAPSETPPVTPTDPPTDQAADPGGTATTDPDQSPSDDPTTDAADGAEDGNDAASAPVAPLAEVAGSPPFSQLEILDLRRDHDAVTVEFAITVDEDHSAVNVADVFAAGPDLFGGLSSEGEATAADARRNSVSGVTLIDRSNAKRHLVLRDSDGHCLCTQFNGIAHGGERYVHSAQLPAPPEEVTEMTVEVPMFPSIDNVPLRNAS